MIPIFSNTLGQEELREVERVFASRWLGAGRECELFEQEFAAHLGVDRVLLFNNCTAATYIALRALGIGEGDEVIIPTIQFVGVANAVIDCGATPIFADVDDWTLNILPSECERLRTDKTKAVFLLHYGGHPCNMQAIHSVLWGLFVLQDCANAVSSRYDRLHIAEYGTCAVFSFDAMKELVACDGGALFMVDKEDTAHAESLRYFGFPPKAKSGTDSMRDNHRRWWEYDLQATSGRFISNDVLAAIGRVQLRKLPGFIARRKAIWEMYQDGFNRIPAIRRPPEPLPGCTTSYYLYWIQCAGRDDLARYLADNGVYTTFRYYPLHMVPYYQADCKLPNAEKAANITLNLPLHQNLTDDDVDRIIGLVRSFVKKWNPPRTFYA